MEKYIDRSASGYPVDRGLPANRQGSGPLFHGLNATTHGTSSECNFLRLTESMGILTLGENQAKK